MNQRTTRRYQRGLKRPDIPEDWGRVDDPTKNLFCASEILRTFAEAQTIMALFRAGQRDPKTRKSTVVQ